MPAKDIKSRTMNAYKTGWTTATKKPIQHTVTHELAHALWNSHHTNPASRAAGKEIGKLFHTWMNDSKKKGYGDYSRSNINEFFAETATKAIHGNSDKYTRKIKYIVKKYKL